VRRLQGTSSHHTVAQELKFDPSRCCLYVLDAVGFWQSSNVHTSVTYDKKCGECYVLSTDVFWRSRHARHRLSCDNAS